MKTQIMSDQVLLSSYLNGDSSAISALILKHEGKLKDYIRILTHDNDLSDDIYQETIIKAFNMISSGKYVESGHFASWMMRIARNKVFDYFRSQKSAKEINEKTAGFDIIGTSNLLDTNMEDSMISEQNTIDLKSLVALLPEDQQEVVRMRYYDELSFKEIAQITGVSINTALGRMRYALINLRKLIREKNIEFN